MLLQDPRGVLLHLGARRVGLHPTLRLCLADPIFPDLRGFYVQPVHLGDLCSPPKLPLYPPRLLVPPHAQDHL
jgi:hypothetical protein